MDSLDLLHYRRSSKKFGDIAPTSAQLELMFKAALRAPDHGRLKPYRFVVITDRIGFEKALFSAVEEFNLGEYGEGKAQKLSHQAPCVVAIIAKLDVSNPKVPVWEQQVCAGCAAYGFQLAANSLGFENVWISKHWVQGNEMRKLLDCQENEQVIGLILVGSPQDKESISRANETENISDFVRYV